MYKDAIVFETGRYWRYYCDEPGCPYTRSELWPLAGAQLAQRIHRHRHAVGLAGVYHHSEGQTHG